MNYIEVLRAMCRCSKSFDSFMHIPNKSNYTRFIKEDADEWCDFTLVYENKEIVIHCTRGATKACFHIVDDPFIIKIGFTNFKVNHAEREFNIYREAVRTSVDQFFVPCQYIGKIFGNPIFTMNFVEMDETKVTSEVWERCSDYMSSDEISEMLEYEEGLVEALFPFYYGADVELLYDFLSKLNIDDLHSGNIGYDEHGDIKLVDYSGYFPVFI